MRTILFWYQFYAVGQGLFTSGHLLRDPERDRRFQWVIDCGTSSRKTYVQREITRFTTHSNGEPIGLFCLSHFDEDHISGARELLSKQRVDVLVMPYFPLVERIRIAFATPGISDDYVRFLIDPAGYMFATAGDNLGEVIFITGGGTPPAAGGDDRVPPTTSENLDDRWELHPPNTEQTVPHIDEDIHGVSDPGSWRHVSVLGHQKPFTVGSVWEFLFFNEHIPDLKATELREQVVEILKKHRRSDGSFNGTALLRELKPLYVRKFGSSGLSQNRISLVVYSGPIEGPRIQNRNLSGALYPVGIVDPEWRDWVGWQLQDGKRSNVSIGYFGDFPLTTPKRVRDVRRHFARRRWNRLHVIQVPHHGSAHSWYDGASGEFHHGVSVLSSARHSKHHPSQSVLDDLSTHGPVLVNEMQHAIFFGQITFR